jgi:hypothetical protein
VTVVVLPLDRGSVSERGVGPAPVVAGFDPALDLELGLSSGTKHPAVDELHVRLPVADALAAAPGI